MNRFIVFTVTLIFSSYQNIEAATWHAAESAIYKASRLATVAGVAYLANDMSSCLGAKYIDHPRGDSPSDGIVFAAKANAYTYRDCLDPSSVAAKTLGINTDKLSDEEQRRFLEYKGFSNIKYFT